MCRKCDGNLENPKKRIAIVRGLVYNNSCKWFTNKTYKKRRDQRW